MSKQLVFKELQDEIDKVNWCVNEFNKTNSLTDDIERKMGFYLNVLNIGIRQKYNSKLLLFVEMNKEGYFEIKEYKNE